MRLLAFICGLALLTSTASADELLTNGGFEAGNFTGWTLGGPAIKTVETSDAGGAVLPNEGNFMASIADPLGVLDGSISQTINAVNVTSATVTFSMRLRGLDFVPFIDTGVDVITASLGGNVIASLSLDDAFDTGAFGIPGFAPSDTGWQTTVLNLGPFAPPINGNFTLSFNLSNIGDLGQSTTAYVDGVSVDVTTAPEPASLALFGAAAAAIAVRIRRRRK